MYLAYENINPILCIAVEFPPRPPPGGLKTSRNESFLWKAK